MAHLIDTRSASTANVVYRALQQFMRWLLDEEEIDRSPMERMRPPIVPEKPVPVITEAQLRAPEQSDDPLEHPIPLPRLHQRRDSCLWWPALAGDL